MSTEEKIEETSELTELESKEPIPSSTKNESITDSSPSPEKTEEPSVVESKEPIPTTTSESILTDSSHSPVTTEEQQPTQQVEEVEEAKYDPPEDVLNVIIVLIELLYGLGALFIYDIPQRIFTYCLKCEAFVREDDHFTQNYVDVKRMILELSEFLIFQFFMVSTFAGFASKGLSLILLGIRILLLILSIDHEFIQTLNDLFKYYFIETEYCKCLSCIYFPLNKFMEKLEESAKEFDEKTDCLGRSKEKLERVKQEKKERKKKKKKNDDESNNEDDDDNSALKITCKDCFNCLFMTQFIFGAIGFTFSFGYVLAAIYLTVFTFIPNFSTLFYEMALFLTSLCGTFVKSTFFVETGTVGTIADFFYTIRDSSGLFLITGFSSLSLLYSLSTGFDVSDPVNGIPTIYNVLKYITLAPIAIGAIPELFFAFALKKRRLFLLTVIYYIKRYTKKLLRCCGKCCKCSLVLTKKMIGKCCEKKEKLEDDQQILEDQQSKLTEEKSPIDETKPVVVEEPDNV